MLNVCDSIANGGFTRSGLVFYLDCLVRYGSTHHLGHEYSAEVPLKIFVPKSVTSAYDTIGRQGSNGTAQIYDETQFEHDEIIFSTELVYNKLYSR